ncbi:uncharacterized protein LOC110847750 [Folsomia candida]|uniref:Ricin B lectin domain-containing protein n=1 Tax=Folsomia candida TaxID=158441 RepID=A0A226EMI5_FOLCA|nr:uncharacterized protein LOC110847750 [Folsomia candida]OXA58224.1 hypothetical protein Fcan01_06598 [Folsomia candida]
MELLVKIFGFLLVAYCYAVEGFPSPDKVYTIRNTIDNGFVKPRGSGEMCTQLSALTCGYRLIPPYEDQYKWTVSAPNNYSVGINIFSKRQESGYSINNLSFEDFPPYCYLIYRNLNLISTENAGSYMIQSVQTGRCLTSYGSELGSLLWYQCGADLAQQEWAFIETQ